MQVSSFLQRDVAAGSIAVRPWPLPKPPKEKVSGVLACPLRKKQTTITVWQRQDDARLLMTLDASDADSATSSPTQVILFVQATGSTEPFVVRNDPLEVFDGGRQTLTPALAIVGEDDLLVDVLVEPRAGRLFLLKREPPNRGASWWRIQWSACANFSLADLESGRLFYWHDPVLAEYSPLGAGNNLADFFILALRGADPLVEFTVTVRVLPTVALPTEEREAEPMYAEAALLDVPASVSVVRHRIDIWRDLNDEPNRTLTIPITPSELSSAYLRSTPAEDVVYEVLGDGAIDIGRFLLAVESFNDVSLGNP